MDSELVARARDVTLYRGAAPVLEAVSFDIAEGAVVAVIGPNGAGKSTLAAALAGRLRVGSGSLDVLGTDLRRADLRRFRTRVGYFSSDLERAIAPGTTLRQAVALGPHAGLRAAWFALDDAELDAAEELLELVGLGGVTSRDLGTVSHGQRQRALLARAFAGSPEFIVLDEPTSHLDVVGREETLRALEALLTSSRAPRATVIVSHHLEELPRQVTTTLLVGNGRVIAGERSLLHDGDALAATFGRRLRVVEVEGRLVARLASLDSD